MTQISASILTFFSIVTTLEGIITGDSLQYMCINDLFQKRKKEGEERREFSYSCLTHYGNSAQVSLMKSKKPQKTVLCQWLSVKADYQHQLVFFPKVIANQLQTRQLINPEMQLFSFSQIVLYQPLHCNKDQFCKQQKLTCSQVQISTIRVLEDFVCLVLK